MDYVTPVTPASNHVAQSSTWCFLFMMLFLYPECLVRLVRLVRLVWQNKVIPRDLLRKNGGESG